jgi:hypothetical protein|tara:strand:+ start:672 stop:899 length:228 start_codon:yes stop_codon:yes gene_type:complete
MKLGKLNYIYNLDKHQAANKGYYHALVFDAVERKYENLIITDGEMKKIRERSRKNPEDAVQPSWFDMIIATIRLY